MNHILRGIAVIIIGVLLVTAVNSVCAAEPLLETTVPSFKLFTYKNITDTSAACDYPDGKGGIRKVHGCFKRGLNPVEIHLVQPSNWCAMNQVETIGHEVMHLVGWHHGPDFVPPYIDDQRATGCRNGEFHLGHSQ